MVVSSPRMRTVGSPLALELDRDRESPADGRAVRDGREILPMALLGRVLLIEQRGAVAKAVRSRLERAGIEVCVARSASDAASLHHRGAFDAVLLSVLLPDTETLRLLREWQQDGLPVQVLALPHADSPEGAEPASPAAKAAAAADLSDLVAAFQTDAPAVPSGTLRVHDLEIDLDNHLVRRAGKRIVLTKMEYQVLECLAQRVGQVVSRAEILEYVRGTGEARCNIVDVYIRYLRRKVDAPFDVPLIQTQYGQGYRLRDDLPVKS